MTARLWVRGRVLGPGRTWPLQLMSSVTFIPCLSLYLDLFVGQLKSCLKCQACGYRSTTFEVFCDLSLPIPKVGFQRTPRVHGVLPSLGSVGQG